MLKSNKKYYSRKTAKNALENVLIKIKEVNKSDRFIYKITKAVLFGSYINSNKDKIGDLDIALYIELKDKTKTEIEQNFRKANLSLKYIPYELKYIYGKEEVFRYVKDKKRILQLHDGNKVDEIAKKNNELISYIYNDKNLIIYKEVL